MGLSIGQQINSIQVKRGEQNLLGGAFVWNKPTVNTHF